MSPAERDAPAPPGSYGAIPSRKTGLTLLAVLFLCVIATHVWMIWMAPTAFSFSLEHVHTDNAVMLLMGKRILEKGELPVFYYGQDWFGSLSAMVHAAVFLTLGGIPPWSIHVAPLLFFLGFCLVLYLLARATLGPAIALVALAWNIATPVALSEYSVMPHGGYVEGLMLGTLILWLSVRLVRAQDARTRTARYALLGFAGGIGWWTSPLVVYHILTAAAFVLLRERRAALLPGATLSLPAFLAGAAPFFYFYARDPYSSVLNMGGGFQLRHVPEGLYLVFVERIPRYLGLDLFQPGWPLAHWLAALVYACALLFFLWHLRSSFRAGHPLRDAAVFPIFFLVFAVLLAASVHVRRNAPLYAMPLSALLPVAIGFWVIRTRSPLAAVAAALVFVLHGVTTASWVVAQAPRAERATRGHLTLVEGLMARGVTHLYLRSTPGSELLGFYARERFIAAQTVGERYPPHFLALEREPDPAFLYRREAPGIGPTLKALGATWDVDVLGSYDLVRHVRASERRYRQVPAREIRASASHGAEAARRALDRDMDSAWTSAQLREPGMWVLLDLGTRRPVGRVCLWNRGEDHGSYAMDVRVETSVDGRLWRAVVPRSAMDHLNWSGPRVYPWEWSYRWEVRFAPVEARYVRVTQYEKDARHPWTIAEAYVYEDLGPAGSGEAPGDQAVVQRVRDLGLRRVYADRWISAKLRETGDDGLWTVTPFTVAEPQFRARLESRLIRWGRRTGFVLEAADADEFAHAMRAEGVHPLAREDLGRWTLFHGGPGAEPEDRPGRDDPGWWWNGLGAVRTRALGALDRAGEAAEAPGKVASRP